MVRWFIHYFENGDRLFPGNTGTRIVDEVRALKNINDAPLFEHVITYRQKDLGEDFVQKHKRHFSHSIGAGYWCWKPYIIKMTLERMADGDELMYCDTCIHPEDWVKPLLANLRNQDVVMVETYHLDRHWAKMDLVHKMNAEGYLDSRQRIASFSFYRKTSRSVSFVNEWVELAADYHLISDEPSVIPNDPSFIRHIHDQAMFSLLTKKYGYTAYKRPNFRSTKILPKRLRKKKRRAAPVNIHWKHVVPENK